MSIQNFLLKSRHFLKFEGNQNLSKKYYNGGKNKLLGRYAKLNKNVFWNLLIWIIWIYFNLNFRQDLTAWQWCRLIGMKII